MNGEMQLDACGWFIEQEKKTEASLNHLRNVRGTFETDRNITYAWLEGYLSGIRAMYRKMEDERIVMKSDRILKSNEKP